MSLETDLQRSQPLENKLTMYRPIQKAYNLSSETFYRFTKEDLSIGDFIESGFHFRFGQQKKTRYIRSTVKTHK
jgi:hypothetical protein